MNSPNKLAHMLVGVHEAEASDHAVRAAHVLSGRLGAGLDLVHAVPIPPALWVGIERARLETLHATTLQLAADAVRDRVSDLERRLELSAGALIDRVRVRAGHPAEVLIEEARKTGAAMIVLGAHTKKGAIDFGSTARAVLHQAPCSVWIQPAAYQAIETILVPLDLSEQSFGALEAARDLALPLSARIVALHCFVPMVPRSSIEGAASWPPDPRALREADRKEFERHLDEFDWKGVEHSGLIREGTPHAQVLDMQDQAQLIVMGTAGRTGLARLFLGNVAYRVLRDARIPVMAIRDDAHHSN